MSRKELIGLINADAKFVDERVDIAEYINTLEAGKALNEKEIREGYLTFKSEKFAKEIRAIAEKNGLQDNTLSAFINGIIGRMIFDGEQLTDLLAPLELSWKTRREKELTLMEDLIPLLKKLAQGKDISGLKAYEE